MRGYVWVHYDWWLILIGFILFVISRVVLEPKRRFCSARGHPNRRC